MKIKRTVNGIEYEFNLTPHEMYECYEEQQHRYDVMDVEQELKDQDLGGIATEEEIENMAYDMRGIIYDTGCDWRSAVEKAVSDWYNQKEG